MLTIENIKDGLRAEAADLPERLSFMVVATERVGDVWTVELNPESGQADTGQRSVVLDEALEGARAWWAGPPKGKASVLAVIPEESKLFLSDIDTQAPSKGSRLYIYTQDYLQILRQIWGRDAWAELAIQSQLKLNRTLRSAPIGVKPDSFPHLRTAQRNAFQLIDYETSFLWGPPGTGKTTTLGALLASCVLQKNGLRILLVGTTNQAVDQALVAVDKALESLGSIARGARERLCRFGSRFLAEHYDGRDHLIPIQDKALLVQMRRLEMNKPDAEAPSEVQAKWLRERQQLKDAIRNQMTRLFKGKSIVAMTASRAAFSLDELSQMERFDLLVFDEASQLGLANALCLLPLANRILFAGDDKQLSPVVVSKAQKAQEALGRSPFKYRGHGTERENMVMLDEQSRMAGPICQAVSEAFYLGKLRVAEDTAKDPKWAAWRKFAFSHIEPDTALKTVDITAEGQWSQKYRGLVRLESAEKLADMVEESIRKRQVSVSDVVILTPFRAQRVLIKRCLYHRDIKGVRVSTVHRSQGSEARVVLFDPVKGDEQFLTNPEGVRLITVALSRAMGKLILALSVGDRNNRHLAQFHTFSIIKKSSFQASPEAVELVKLLNEQPKSRWKDLLGKRVKHGRHVGNIKALNEPQDILVLASEVSGRDHEYQISALCKNGRSGPS